MPEGSNDTRFRQDDSGFEIADTVDGIHQRNARNWQIIALVSVSTFILSLAVALYALTRPAPLPLVVTVTPDGEAKEAGRLEYRRGRTGQSVPEVAKVYQIKRFIERSHIWVGDREAQRMYIREAASLTQGAAAKELDAYYRENNPYEQIGKKTRTVTIDPPLKQSEKTYIIYFNTEEKNSQGYPGKRTRWSVLVNLEDGYEAGESNPLGLYITNFDIKQLEVLP